MATTRNQLTVPHSSSSSSSLPWDVFLSFYGKDTRNNFTSHLYSALVQAGIHTFMDEPELQKGEEISQGLRKAIHGSKIFVVVLSKNYASSRWCLDELVEILTCYRTNGQVVIPVFYYVDPSDLRYNKRSFGEAFESHKKCYSVDVIRELEHIDSLELFSYHAFRKPAPPESFRELTVSFVTYAGGLPLAVKVLGSSLRSRTHVSFWKDKLENVRKIPDKEIQKILQLSYDELDVETQKAIFLNVAFFFIGKDKDEAVHNQNI